MQLVFYIFLSREKKDIMTDNPNDEEINHICG